jgi:glycosyltransferase involved in cell wall biosynthesis
MGKPLISCIIPVYNSELYLGEAIDSILAQTYQPVEIIIVDDGSTDATAEVAAHYGTQISYLRQSNQGPATARNLGLSAAQGEFIAFLDADDLWNSEKLTREMARLQERPEIDLCFTRFQHFWAPELAEEAKRYQGHPLSQPLSAYLVSSLIVRRTVFETFGQFDNGLRGPENMIWLFRTAEEGAIIEVLPDVLTYRRIHRENLTKKHPSQREFLDATFFPILKAWRDYQRRRQDG